MNRSAHLSLPSERPCHHPTPRQELSCLHIPQGQTWCQNHSCFAMQELFSAQRTRSGNLERSSGNLERSRDKPWARLSQEGDPVRALLGKGVICLYHCQPYKPHLSGLKGLRALPWVPTVNTHPAHPSPVTCSGTERQ